LRVCCTITHSQHSEDRKDGRDATARQQRGQRGQTRDSCRVKTEQDETGRVGVGRGRGPREEEGEREVKSVSSRTSSLGPRVGSPSDMLARFFGSYGEVTLWEKPRGLGELLHSCSARHPQAHTERTLMYLSRRVVLLGQTRGLKLSHTHAHPHTYEGEEWGREGGG
jgi:hypothetical protein